MIMVMISMMMLIGNWRLRWKFSYWWLHYDDVVDDDDDDSDDDHYDVDFEDGNDDNGYVKWKLEV